MRILHVADSLDERLGGSARAPLDIATALAQHGHEVVVVGTQRRDEPPRSAAEVDGSPRYWVFPQRFPRHFFRSPSLRRWLGASVGRFTVVEVHSVFSFVSLYAAWACRRSAVPYTVRPHGSLDPFDLRKHSLAKRLYGPLVVRPFLGGAAAVVLTSQLEANRVVTFGASPPKVVIPLPIVGSEVHADGREFRERHGIPANATVVLFLGRVDPKKGLQFLVPSLAELKRSHPDLWFVLAGDGRRDEVAVVDAMLQAHDMAGWTVRCGFIGGREKQGALVASDLFALPSLNENFGIAVVEAMQAGLPVVISDEVYLHTELNAAGAAVVCRPAMSSCKDALESLLADSDLRRAMGARAREAASALFDPNVVLPQLLQLYRTISAADVANIDPTG